MITLSTWNSHLKKKLPPLRVCLLCFVWTIKDIGEEDERNIVKKMYYLDELK